MCGVVGIFDCRGERAMDGAVLNAMNEAQHHRGPNDGSLHIEPGLGLGHRRLSIIDVAGGHQPVFNEDGTVLVMFNGEIYNFRDLTKELTAAGHKFKTHSDTEAIVHAWEQWGPRCVEKLRGMFAFAIWDRPKRTLFLARDRVGIKPLYYSFLPDGTLVFASELKGLLAHPDVKREFEPTAIEDFFAFGYVPDPKTILRGVLKLAPGFTLTVVRGGPTAPVPEQYWDVPLGKRISGDAVELTEEFERRLSEAVSIHMISEVPLGAFLSGGIDSTTVVGMMASQSSEPIKTCSIAFSEQGFDETQYAERVARLWRTDHRVEQVNTDDFDLLDILPSVYDEPFADSSALPTYRVCELARRHVTVALSGDGGDETHAGYRRYRWHRHEERLRSALPLSLRRVLFGGLARIYPRAYWAPRPLRAKATFAAMARDSVEGYMTGLRVMAEPINARLFKDDFRRSLNGYRAIDVLESHMRSVQCDDPVSAVQYLDMKTYLPGDILTKVDRASMAHSLEVRVPLLDHELVEWAFSLPPNAKINGNEGKYLLKRALEPRLGREFIYRRKQGFAVPLAKWFRGPLRDRVRRTMLGERLASLGIFHGNVLETIVDEHIRGRADHSPALWALLMFDACHGRLVGGAT
jgi:asparagine synthase (glutamine-hydrolysing)